MRADQLVAPVFVVLWSTGFIGAKLGLPHAGPMTFLALRFGIVAGVLWLWVGLSGSRRLTPGQGLGQAFIGFLLHGVYLGGVFIAISWGIEAGLSALIVGLQPILTALLARQFMAERLKPMQWLGMGLGLAGVALVVARKVGEGLGDGWGVLACVIGLVGICVGSLLQKQLGSDTPMRSGSAMQFSAAAATCALAAWLMDDRGIVWHPDFVIALMWSIFVLSLGAITLLYMLIRRGGASNVASLFFLVPPSTALIAWAMFGETLGLVEMAGVAVTAIGVLMVNRPERFRLR